MKFSVEWIDVAPYLESNEQPVFIIERPLPQSAEGNVKGNLFNVAEVARVGRWWVVTSDLTCDPVDFSETHTGQYVRVPVFAYKTNIKAPASIWGTGLQFGMSALEALRRNTSVDVESCKLVLGHECHDVDNAFRCYAGMAFKMKE